MLLSKDYKVGKTFEELDVGTSLQITENIEGKDLLLYLGLTNDQNPLYIQQEYAALTTYEKPVVPVIMLSGIITSAISKYIPGPGAYISAISLRYPKPLHHDETLHLHLKIVAKNRDLHELDLQVEGKNNDAQIVVYGNVLVVPPKK